MYDIDDLTYEQDVLEAAKARKAAYELQRAKLRALQDALGNYGNFRYIDLEDFIDPNNQNWNDYTYKLPDSWFSREHGRVDAGTPVGMFIKQIRDAENIDDVNKQFKLWNSYKPLDSSDNGISYIRYFIPGFGAYRNTPSIGSRPIQTTAGGTSGTGGTQGAQTGNTGGSTPSKQGVVTVGGAGTGGTGATSGMRTGNSGGNTDSTYASSGVPKGGTKTIGYDPNPGGVSLAYTLRNEPKQVQRDALIDKWNQEHGISYVTGKDGLIYRIDPQHPNGYVDPFKNDLSKTGSTYASPSVNTGGTYATGEGIKDANGNVLTNPGGDWEYQYALQNPQYGLGMMGKMSDAQRNYLQAVSNNMGYNYNFKGATRFV